MDARLVELESRYTHLQRQCDELSEVVFEQRKLLERLRDEVAELRNLVAPGPEFGGAEKPPHY